MRIRTRSSVGITCALGALAVAVVVAQAAGTPAKRWVCHGTAAATNPYVLIYVNDNSVLQGHMSHGPSNSPDQIATADPPATDDFSGECLALWNGENGPPPE